MIIGDGTQEMIFGNGTQEQAPLATNGEKVQALSYYEIDHKHLHPWIPSTEFYHRRICLVTEVTEANVEIWYPSPESLQSHFATLNPKNHPALDRWCHIKSEVASKVLFRKVDRQEYEEKKHTKSFWQANLNRPQVINIGRLKPGIEQKLKEEKKLKRESPVMESKRDDKSSVSINHVETRLRNLKIHPTSRVIQGSRRSLTISMTPGASHFTRKSHKKVTPKAIGQKVDDISQAFEDLKDKNNASVISLSDSEDDIVVVADKQRSQVMSSDVKTSIKRKLLPRNEGFCRNKKSTILQQTTNISDSLSDEKMQEIIYGLLNVGISQSDVGKAAEFCYNDPAKAKVLFALPSHMRRSYVLGFLYPRN